MQLEFSLKIDQGMVAFLCIQKCCRRLFFPHLLFGLKINKNKIKEKRKGPQEAKPLQLWGLELLVTIQTSIICINKDEYTCIMNSHFGIQVPQSSRKYSTMFQFKDLGH